MRKTGIIITSAFLIAASILVKEARISAMSAAIQSTEAHLAFLDDKQQQLCASDCTHIEVAIERHFWLMESLQVIGYYNSWPALCLSSFCSFIPDVYHLKTTLEREHEQFMRKSEVPPVPYHFEQGGILERMIGES